MMVKYLSYYDFLDTLDIVDRQYVKSFFENNFEQIEKKELHFSPCQHSIKNIDDFYQKVDLYISEPEQYDNGAFLFAQRFCYVNSSLPTEGVFYLPEKKRFYFQSADERLRFKVADSLSELLNRLGFSEMLGDANDDDDDILDPYQIEVLEDCYGAPLDKNVVNFYGEVYKNNAITVDMLFPDGKENEDVLYERGDYEISFPFKPLQEKRLGFPVEDWYVFARGTGEVYSNCAEDEGILIYNTKSGDVYRYEYLDPIISSLPWWNWRSLLGLKQLQINSMTKIADSFKEFLSKLESHGWKPINEL